MPFLHQKFERVIKTPQKVPKPVDKITFQDPNLSPTDNKNAIETPFKAILSLQKAHKYLGKVKFLGVI